MSGCAGFTQLPMDEELELLHTPGPALIWSPVCGPSFGLDQQAGGSPPMPGAPGPESVSYGAFQSVTWWPYPNQHISPHPASSSPNSGVSCSAVVGPGAGGLGAMERFGVIDHSWLT